MLSLLQKTLSVLPKFVFPERQFLRSQIKLFVLGSFETDYFLTLSVVKGYTQVPVSMKVNLYP